jgi:electron transfer flavoprotein alpha subunit
MEREMIAFKGVMVYGEAVEGKLTSCATELLGCGRKLADELHEDLICVSLGDRLPEAPTRAIAYGADRVYGVEDPLLVKYQPDCYVAVLERLIEEINPKIVLLGQTDIGRDLAPRLAFRLRVGLCMDCIELTLDSEKTSVEQVRPIFGGNALAVYTSKGWPQIVTVRQRAMLACEPDESRSGEIKYITANLDRSAIRTRVLEIVKEEIPGIKLEDAQVVITGGRGIGGAEGFEVLRQLAKVLNGAVGATRPPCESGWISSTAQIGLTGRIVTPELYIAVAVSGASQHLAGCSGAKTIIAINQDPEANIFKAAEYGVVDDWKRVVPAFVKRVKELLVS